MFNKVIHCDEKHPLLIVSSYWNNAPSVTELATLRRNHEKISWRNRRPLKKFWIEPRILPEIIVGITYAGKTEIS